MLYDVLIVHIIVFNLIDICVTLWLVSNQIAIEANPLMAQAIEKIAKYSILSAFVVYLILMLYFWINIVLIT